MLKKSMQKLNKISLAHYHQGVSSSKNEMNMPPFATQIKKKKKILKLKSSTLIW